MNGKVEIVPFSELQTLKHRLDDLLPELRDQFLKELSTRGGVSAIVNRATRKANGSWITEMDFLMHDWLALPNGPFSLHGLFPALVVSEESGQLDALLNQIQSTPSVQAFWLIDPVDGTRDLVEQRGGYCVCLALMVRSSALGAHMESDPQAFQPVLGAIMHPLSGAQWVGLAGDPQVLRRHTEAISSFVDLRDLRRDAEPTEVFSTSIQNRHAEMRISVSSNSEPSDRYSKVLEALRVGSMTKIGSAVKFGLLLDNKADFYLRFGPTSEWDTAAGDALLRSGFGKVIDLQTLKPLTYCKTSWKNGSFLAVRPDFDAEGLLTEIRHALAQISQ